MEVEDFLKLRKHSTLSHSIMSMHTTVLNHK